MARFERGERRLMTNTNQPGALESANRAECSLLFDKQNIHIAPTTVRQDHLLSGYRLDRWLNVSPIWEGQHD